MQIIVFTVHKWSSYVKDYTAAVVVDRVRMVEWKGTDQLHMQTHLMTIKCYVTVKLDFLSVETTVC